MSAADSILVVHFAIVVFIVGGLILTWVGAWLSWGWIRNPWFRYAHLGGIAFIALEAVIGMACPLTVLEDALRGGGPAESFVGRWVRYFLFYRAPEWVFTTIYLAWAAATVVTLRLVPPRPLNRRARPSSAA